MDVRRLHEPDRAEVMAFLQTHANTTLFLQNNLEKAGFVDDGTRLSGAYAGVYEGGQLAAVAMHAWNGMLILCTPMGAGAVARAVVGLTKRPVAGLMGIVADVAAARAGLGLGNAATRHDGHEPLYVLELDRLRVPPAYDDPALSVRLAGPEDVSLLTEWWLPYHAEALGDTRPADERRGEVQAGVDESIARGDRRWILEDNGTPVSMTGFNSTTRDCVQVGGVWTPVDLRGRGYGRVVVAASLLDARAEGASRSVLFTAHDNLPAQRCYEGLGYVRAGNYALVLFEEPQEIES
jgi:predicted GNAT family acetyltransferase